MSRVVPYVSSKKAKDYINMRMEQLKDHDVDVWFGRGKRVCLEGGYAHGYFCEDPRELRVATGSEFKIWFPVFVHETCHFDQWREQAPIWTSDQIHGTCPYMILDHQATLVRKNVPLTIDAARAIRAVEEDCERRAIKQIKEYDLPINLKFYSKTANAYMYLHNMYGITQRWQNKKFSYMNPRILDAMPSEFQESFDDMPMDYIKLYHECGF